MNKVILAGRLTRDPAVSYAKTKSGDQMAVARFTLAVDRRYAKKEAAQTADFISCVCLGKLAQFGEKYLFQGTKIILEGRIQTGSYVNKEGQRIYTTDVMAEAIEFAESKKSAAPEERAGYEEPSADGFIPADDEEGGGLPFG